MRDRGPRQGTEGGWSEGHRNRPEPRTAVDAVVAAAAAAAAAAVGCVAHRPLGAGCEAWTTGVGGQRMTAHTHVWWVSSGGWRNCGVVRRHARRLSGTRPPPWWWWGPTDPATGSDVGRLGQTGRLGLATEGWAPTDGEVGEWCGAAGASGRRGAGGCKHPHYHPSAHPCAPPPLAPLSPLGSGPRGGWPAYLRRSAPPELDPGSGAEVAGGGPPRAGSVCRSVGRWALSSEAALSQSLSLLSRW